MAKGGDRYWRNRGKNNPMCGKHHTQEAKSLLKLSKLGNKNPNWKGDMAGYWAIHTWVRRHLVKPKLCGGCGAEVKLEAANISGKYLRLSTDWEWLCRHCHMQKDGRLERLIQRNKNTKKIKEDRG